MNKFYFFIFGLIFIIGNANGQTGIIDVIEHSHYMLNLPLLSFKEKMNITHITFTPNAHFSFTETTFEDYLNKPHCDNIYCFLKDQLHATSATFRHEDGQCEIFIYSVSAYQMHISGKLRTTQKGPEYRTYQIITEFRTNYISKNTLDKLEEDYQVYYYTQDSARMNFNADYMMTYPYTMWGVHGKDFTEIKVIIAGKKSMDIFVYFVMTEKGAPNFEKYLADFRGTLWFENF